MALVELGRIIRLQVQRSSLKRGPARERYYDPAPIVAVDSLLVGPDGVVAVQPGGDELVDVHNARHPETKNRELNPVSLGFTSHYAAMRRRFGDHLANGIAGENILIDADRLMSLRELERGVVIESTDGRRLELSAASVAHPCVEFSRFALDEPDASALVVSQALRFLDNGTRGFYLRVAASATEVRVGDLVYVAGA